MVFFYLPAYLPACLPTYLPTYYGAGGKQWIIVDVMVDIESRKLT